MSTTFKTLRYSEKHTGQRPKTRILAWAVALASWVALSKSLQCSQPQFLQWEMKAIDHTNFQIFTH